MDIENASDRSRIGLMGDLDRPREDEPYFEFSTGGRCMLMKAVMVVPDGDRLHITTGQGETFVFETVSEDEYGLVANGRSGEWYTEVDEQLVTENTWLLIHPPEVPDEVRIPLKNAVQDLGALIEALQQTKKQLEFTSHGKREESTSEGQIHQG